MHQIVAVGILGYGADPSANQAARPRCRVCNRSRDLFIDNDQATCFLTAASENPALPQHAGEMAFGANKIAPPPPCLQSTSKLGAGRYGLPDSLSPDPLAPLANEEPEVLPKISMKRGSALCLPQCLFKL
jgi:hypothetical protein